MKGIGEANLVKGRLPMEQQEQKVETEVKSKFFTLFVDGKEFHIEKSSITSGESMDLAGIPRDGGLIEVLEDGSQVQIKVDDVIDLQPERRFKQAPRFVSG